MAFDSLNNKISSISAAALLIGAAGLFSRVLGVLRDRMLAGHFGASRELDIYYAAFQVPDFMYNIFLLGAASAAIIPIFTELKERDETEARKLIQRLLLWFGLAAAAISVVAALFMPFLVSWTAPGFSVSEKSATALLGRLMMLSPFLLGLSSIISAVIQSYKRFLVFSLSPVFYNLGIIAGIIFFLPIFGLKGLALGIILGAGLHLLVQIPSFAQLGFFNFSSKDRKEFDSNKELKKVIKLSFPRVVAASLGSLTSVALIAAASKLASGSIAVFQLSSNLSYLPVGLFGVSFAVAAFPTLTESAIRQKGQEFLETFYGSLRSIIFWVLPLAIFFYVLRAQIVRVALGAGEFSWRDTRLTAASLGLLFAALIANSVIPLLIRTFYALGNTKKPLLINFAASLFTVGLALGLPLLLNNFYPLSSILGQLLKVADLKPLGVLGIPLAFSIGALLNMFLLTGSAVREIHKKWTAQELKATEKPWKAILNMTETALISGFVCYGALRAVNAFISLETFVGVLTQGFLAFAVGALTYGLGLEMTGNEEMERLWEIIKNRMIKLRILPRTLDGEGLK